MLVPEFTNLVVIHRDLPGYLGALGAYAVLLIMGYGVLVLIDRSLPGPLWSNVVAILVFGFAGLAVEWFLIGNSPWGNPDAIQWGMFVYWVGLFMIPRIMVDVREGLQDLQRRIRRVYGLYVALHLVLALVLPVRVLLFVIPLLWTVAYTLFGFFYMGYIRRLQE